MLENNNLQYNKFYFQHISNNRFNHLCYFISSDCTTSSYPKVQVVFHVLEKTPNHSSQVNDVCWPMFFKHRPCLLHVPKEWGHNNSEWEKCTDILCFFVTRHMFQARGSMPYIRLASLEERNIHSSPSLAPPSSLTTCCMALPTKPDPPVTNTLRGAEWSLWQFIWKKQGHENLKSWRHYTNKQGMSLCIWDTPKNS